MLKIKRRFNVACIILALVLTAYIGQLFYTAKKMTDLSASFESVDGLLVITKATAQYSATEDEQTKLHKLLTQQKQFNYGKLGSDVLAELDHLLTELINGKQDSSEKQELVKNVQKKALSLIKVHNSFLENKFSQMLYHLKATMIIGFICIIAISLWLIVYVRSAINKQQAGIAEFWMNPDDKGSLLQSDDAIVPIDLGNFATDLLEQHQRLLLEFDRNIAFERMTTDPILLPAKVSEITQVINTSLFAFLLAANKDTPVLFRIGEKHSTIIIAISLRNIYLPPNYHDLIFHEGASEYTKVAKLVEYRNCNRPQRDFTALEEKTSKQLDIVDLSKVKEIVENYAGEMWIENDDEYGLILWINIPEPPKKQRSVSEEVHTS